MAHEPVKNTTEDVIALQIDNTLQETKAHGTDRFPFQYYDTSFDWKMRDYVDWHWHRELEFLILKSEAMVCRIGEQTLHLRKGDCILVNSGMIHRYEAPVDKYSEPGRWISILFSTDLIASRNSVIYEKNILPILMSGEYCFDFRKDLKASDQSSVQEQREILHAGVRLAIREIVEEICSICQEDGPVSELAIHIALCRIWKKLSENLPEEGQTAKGNKNRMLQARLRVMLQYIWENFSESIRLEDLARAANISISMVQRCFKACLNESANQYLQRYRLEHAKQLLLTTNCSVLEAALSSGFGTVGYFDYVFKREFGMTPKQFTKNNR